MLVDTHILIWVLDGVQGRMGDQTRRSLEGGGFNQAVISAVSLLEIRLKQRRGKLPRLVVEDVIKSLREQGVTMLPVSPEHTARVATTETIKHADPFDLLLIAQAITENLPLLTCDKKILEATIPGLRTVDATT